MNLTMQKTDNVNARLTVSVVEPDYKAKVTEELKRIGKTHQIPGFRKGHISVADLQRRFGRQVTSDVINQVVYESVMKYIQDEKLNVLGAPMPVEVKELDIKNQKDFTFEYDLGLAPELDIKLDKSVELPYYTIEVTDSMIDEQDKALRKRFGSQVPGELFEEDALVKGDIKELNADGSVKDGEDAISVSNGIVAPFHFSNKDEAAKFTGKKVGDKVVFNPRKANEGDIAELASMLNIDKTQAEGVDGDFELTISEIIVVRPAEPGEEFYQQVFGADKVHNEEEYRDGVKNMITNELGGNSEMIFRFATRKVLMDKYGNMQLPDTILKKWLISRNEGINEGNVDEEYSRMEDDLKWQLIKERIAAIASVKIDDADLLAHAKHTAARQFAQYGMSNMDDETLTRYAHNILDDKNYRPRIVEQVGDIKLFAAIKNAVTINEKTVSLDEFKDIASKI